MSLPQAENEIEAAAEYLQKHNFKSLIEWMTAEVILSRPSDPFPFLRDLLHSKISTRADGYKPEDNSTYVQECYKEASDSADEHGRIPLKEGKSGERCVRGEGRGRRESGWRTSVGVRLG